MEDSTIQQLVSEKIQLLSSFKKNIRRWFDGNYSGEPEKTELRSQINRAVQRVQNIVSETGCLRLLTMSPPPAIGGLISQNINPFSNIWVNYYGMSLIPDVADMVDATIGVLESPEYLEKLLENLENSGEAVEQQKLVVKALQRVLQLCVRFHFVARQLQARHGNRSTLKIRDEYDVQDLFGSILRIDFDDVRKEEWTPSYAGKSSRVDFLLKRENIIVEIKKTRTSLAAKEVGDQLLIDIARYKAHPACNTLVCFIYDPEGRIGNPAELEDDLRGLHDRIDVHVVIAPKGS